jgi:hypothetical protein
MFKPALVIGPKEVFTSISMILQRLKHQYQWPWQFSELHDLKMFSNKHSSLNII